VTTFCTVCAALRTSRIVPLKRVPGYASTENVASMPLFSLPTSASATNVSTWIERRSCAMVNSVGDCSDAATVCPTSMLRESTMPSIGDLMMVNERLTSASLALAAALESCACATAMSALVADTAVSARS
jgi:hypothetical protein